MERLVLPSFDGNRSASCGASKKRSGLAVREKDALFDLLPMTKGEGVKLLRPRMSGVRFRYPA